MRIGITGARGFLGWHHRVHLLPDAAHAVLAIDREDFQDTTKVAAWVSGCDAVVHLAGMNRGDEREIRRVNVDLAERLVAACDAAGVTPQIVFANSTHAERDTAYGASKRAAAAVLAEWSQRSGAIFTNLIIPHAFGECGRPFYNSAIATFCHQLARGESPRIIQDMDLELVHAQEIARAALAALVSRRSGDIRLEGVRIRVSEALARLQSMADQYRKGLIPRFENRLDCDLFNAYRCCLFPQGYPVGLELRSDARGALFEAVQTLHGGQCFVSTTRPGVTRGNHYHRHKMERFLVLHGDALIRVRRLLDGEAVEYRVSGTQPAYVDMPTLHTHNITNTGESDLVTLFWTNEIFDPKLPDTYREPV
jgi:UDP-2-acetamido-2,6-beta-L-arabino-hexul-4-ose reductase